MSDIYGPASSSLWVYSQYAKKNMRDLEGITQELGQTDPQNAARLNELQIRINLINQSLTYAQDIASLIMTVSKLPT